MKIPLNMGDGGNTTAAQKTQALGRLIKAAREGDWDAKSNLARQFTPLLTSLAEKRSSDIGEINNLIEAGKKGLYRAARKSKAYAPADRFQIFALDFIEREMDRVQGGGGGLLSRLFGG